MRLFPPHLEENSDLYLQNLEVIKLQNEVFFRYHCTLHYPVQRPEAAIGNFAEGIDLANRPTRRAKPFRFKVQYYGQQGVDGGGHAYTRALQQYSRRLYTRLSRESNVAVSSPDGWNSVGAVRCGCPQVDRDPKRG